MKICSEITTAVECRTAKDNMNQGPCAETYTTCSDSVIQNLKHLKNAFEARLEDCTDVKFDFKCGMGMQETEVGEKALGKLYIPEPHIPDGKGQWKWGEKHEGNALVYCGAKYCHTALNCDKARQFLSEDKDSGDLS